MALSKKKKKQFLKRLFNGEDPEALVADMKVSPKDFTELVVSDLKSFTEASVPNLTQVVLLNEKKRRYLDRIGKLQEKIDELTGSESEPEVESEEDVVPEE